MKKYFFLNALFFCSLSAQTVTLQECIDKTLNNHPDIKSFMLEVSKSEQAQKSAHSAYLPHLNFLAQYDVLHTYVLPQNGEFRTLDEQGWQAGVTLQQKIWDFSQTSSKIDAAVVDTQIASLSVEEAKALMVYKVTSLYETALVQKKAIAVFQKDMQTKKELHKQAHALVEQGIKTSSDETRFLSAYYASKDSLGTAEASYEKALSTLWLYMGEKKLGEITLQTNLLTDTSADKTTPEQLSDELLANNTQLKMYEQNIQKSTFLHNSAKASHYGSLDAVASYTYFDTLNAYDASVVGVVLNIPLYTGGSLSAAEQTARIATSSAKEFKNGKILALQEELEALLIDLRRYENTILAKKSQLEASVATKELINARYKEGLATYIEVLDGAALELSSELGLLEAYFSRSMALNRIKYLTGKQI